MSSALLPYRPVRTTAPRLVRRGDVTPLAWTGMLLDGALVPVWGDVAAPADRDVTPELRLAALGDLVPRRGVVGRAAAAWVHTGGAPPDRIDVLVRPGGRRVDPHPSRRACEGPLPAGDVLVLPTGRVTAVQRTGLDVARWEPDETAARLLAALLPLGFDPGAALRTLEATAGGRHVRRAQRLLDGLAASS